MNPGDHILFRFEILSELGKGSFSCVVKCFDHKLKQTVAIKVSRNLENNNFAAREL